MTTPFNSEELFDELVFENRNKEYGAYVIRRSYNETMTRSMLISLGLVAALILAVAMLRKNGPEKVVIPPLEIMDTVEWHTNSYVEEKRTVEKRQERKVQKTDDANYKASDQKQDDQVKPNELLVTGKGDPKGTTDSVASQDPPPFIPEVTSATPPPAVLFVDAMPEYDHMNKFILDNLVYPEVAKENGTTGIVVISFIVETDGSISNVKIARGIGDGCEEEALRVVQMMKKWKPGMLKGVVKRVVVNLPVKFSLK